MTPTHTTPNGTPVRITPGRRQYLPALSLGLTGHETPADLLALGLTPVPPSPPSALSDQPSSLPPAPILDIADQILSTWSATRLPVPADWDQATALLESSPDPDILRLAIRLLALRLRLSEAGGAWQHVLDRASTQQATGDRPPATPSQPSPTPA